jgi:hypothetical protein
MIVARMLEKSHYNEQQKETEINRRINKATAPDIL